MNLQVILKGVSRSFYLSLRGLPRPVRPSMELAFLLCKTADTIADTRLIPLDKRLHYLERFRAHWQQPDVTLAEDLIEEIAPIADNPAERDLLTHLRELFGAVDCLALPDKERIVHLVRELTLGMITDLKEFPGETAAELKAFQTETELDRYTYFVAGCVGKFWTKMLGAHFRFAQRWDQQKMEQTGETFGKGLQMVNILRDLPLDLRRGRCYLPADSLASCGITPQDLLKNTTLPQVKPLLEDFLGKARTQLRAGLEYAMGHPVYALRLKWVVLVPMQLGYQTLQLLESSPQWLNPAYIHKVSRSRVYKTLLQCLFIAARPRLTGPAAASSEFPQTG